VKKHRRGHNEGSIYQRKDGRWVAGQTLEGRKRVYYYGKTRAEVQAKLLAGLKATHDGISIAQDGRKSVEQYVLTWLKSIKPQVKPKTYTTYEGLVRLHIVPALGKVKLVKLTPEHLQRFYSERIDTGLSPQSVRHMNAVLHRALEDAVRWNNVARNVADLVTPPRVERREMKVLAPEEARRFLDTVRTERIGALYILAITTGLRQGELLALRWRDVDLEARSLRITGTLQRGEAGLAIAAPKTATSRRQVLLGTMAIEALRDHRIRQNAERLLLGPAWENNDLVFANEVGRPIEATNLLRRSFKPLLKAAGVPAIRFHDLRHSAATLLLSQGIHPKVVSEMLGHAQVGITLNLYSHVTPTMQRQAADAMDSLLGATRL
jgi:integrase